jgi:uncharacterized protein YndB with AHSA1/START domain
MAIPADGKRTDAASRVIKAAPRTIYQAFIDPAALMSWLPPEGMTGRIDAFDPNEGGIFRMTLTHDRSDHEAAGKASEHSDVVKGRFLTLVPNERIVQRFEFEADDPAFAGAMTMTWNFTAVPGGTEVTIVCEDVPVGIKKDDHDKGLKSSLDNLAAFTE